MERNTEWNGTRNGMVHFCMEWNETKNVEWNRRELVCRVGLCHFLCILTYDFHMGRVEPRGGGGGGGGGGTVILSSYVGSGPASTFHPKKYQVFQAPQKNI